MLQQPGRFLVLPSRYHVARRNASVGRRAYAPAIALYAVIDTGDESRSRVAVEAVLEPDLPPFARKELIFALSSLAPKPFVDYPTEACRDVRFSWSLPTGLAIEPQALRVPNGFRASLGAYFLGAMLLHDLLVNAGSRPP